MLAAGSTNYAKEPQPDQFNHSKPNPNLNRTVLNRKKNVALCKCFAFWFRFPPQGVKALLVNFRNEKIAFAAPYSNSIHSTPLTHSRTHSFIRSVSQSKVRTLFFLSAWLRKYSPWFRIWVGFGFFFLHVASFRNCTLAPKS